MAITAAEPDFPQIRRLEAASFRAWPAASVRFDGTWQVRLTAGHPSRRLNSVNPLDPSDHRHLEARLENAERLFDAYGRTPVFRMSPLAPAELAAFLEERGWDECDETLVMIADMTAMDLSDAQDQLPLHDVGRYVDASLAVHGREPSLKAGLTEVLNAIRPTTGYFVLQEVDGRAISSLLCVHDNDLAGFFEIGTRADRRRRRHGSGLVRSALRWARLKGAKRAWLQVEAENEAAVALYRTLGFEEMYRYVYRQRSNG